MKSKATKLLHILLGPLVGLLVYWIFPEVDARDFIPESYKGTLPSSVLESNIMAKTAAVAVWMAYWWVMEAVKIYFTALLPLILFPLFGIVPMSEVAPLFMKDVVFLFIGGFLLAFGLERWNLHKRIALKLILTAGGTPARILFGFMFASYFLSMWIMNTATVAMLLPAVIAVIDQLNKASNEESKLGTPFLLGLAFAASIGGMATLIGTAPNLIFMDFFNSHYPDVQEITFGNWFSFAMPLSFVLFLLAFSVLRLLYRKVFNSETVDMRFCEEEYVSLGKMGYEEKVISVLFVFTVLLWFTMKDVKLGGFILPGWSSLFPEPSYIKESTVAMFAAAVFYLFPAKNKPGGLILWEDIQKVPIGIIFLFGGGFALAKAFEGSGLSSWLAGYLEFVSELPPFATILVLCLFMTFLTELTSNTASTLLVLPILFSFAAGIDCHPLQIFIPVTISASCAFMLPVATPPNTIVFGSERLSIHEMMRAGIWLNVSCALIVSAAAFTIIGWAYGV